MKKLLVANRGEIAMRIMRSAKEMGISTVAIFSDADRTAPHVRYADEAVCVGPPPSNQSYLQGEKIIGLCKKLGVDAVHPGYGFLSENSEFAAAVEAAGITFVGPSPESMSMMGDKLSAKAAVKSYGIPMVPGTEEAVSDIDQAVLIAEKIGFPVMIKAAAGGGGKGMRVVNQAADLGEQMRLAMSEAESSFGNGAVFIEKYVDSPRHIEIQVLADKHGNVVHLFDRECSIQRRHQKVIEEAPSAVVSPAMRAEMGECAKKVARACNYVGAGTVEFLVDSNMNFYFLEMNTRLQVEHPVTELITGIDLVKEQLLVAQGLPLRFKQEDLHMNGHAIESRVYAEDPYNNFLPDIGTLDRYERPQGPGVRVDDGFEQGMSIPIYYDPMISKLIVHGKDREESLTRMIRAIDEYHISGVQTTLPFCRFVMKHESFTSGAFNTHFVQDHFRPESFQQEDEAEMELAALITAHVKQLQKDSGRIQENNSSLAATASWKQNRTRRD